MYFQRGILLDLPMVFKLIYAIVSHKDDAIV